MLTFSLQAQVELPVQYVRDSKLKSSVSSTNYEGTPYLVKDFVLGKLTIDNDKVFNVSLRYNAYTDEFEMKDSKQAIVAVLKKSNIVVEILSTRYKLFDYGGKLRYFTVLNTEGTTQLLKRDIKKFFKAKDAQNGYSSSKPARFVLKSEFFFKKSNSIRQINLNKKTILAALNEKAAKLKKFIKTNKLKLKNEDEVIKLINYYNSI